MLGRAAVSAIAVGQLWPEPAPDLLTLIRERAVGSLQRYIVSLDGQPVPVESERIDVVEVGSTPRLIVYADLNAPTKSKAGTAPAFDVTMTMIVQCVIAQATRDGARRQIDELIAQVKDCLFRDPAWVALSANIRTYRTGRQFKPNAELILGDGRVQIECTWTEIYRPFGITRNLTTLTMTTAPRAGTPPIAFGLLPTS